MPRVDAHIRKLYKAIQSSTDIQSPNGTFYLQTKSLGEVNFPTGQVVVSDPFVMWKQPPFGQKIPRGKHPVQLCLASIKGDQRIAASILKLRDDKPSRWEMAFTAEQKIKKLEPDEIVGFGVDSGCAGIMDKTAAAVLERRLGKDASSTYYFKIINQMEITYSSTRDWTIFDLKRNSLNFAVFSSGYGDGFYASYWGFNRKNQVVCLVTDFGVIDTHWVK